MNRLTMKLVMAAGMVTCAATLPAFAQDREPKAPGAPTTPPARQTAPGPGGRAMTARLQLTAEQLQRAWELEAKGTAARIGLDDEQVSKLVEAYSDSRQALQAESDKQRQALREKMLEARESGGDMPDRRAMAAEMQKAIDEFAAAERTKLQTAFGTFLDAKQTEGAMQSLGALAPMVMQQWDAMVHTVADFALEPQTNTQAMAAIEKYVITASQVRSAEGDDARTIIASARTELETSMKSLLTEEQLGQFKVTMGGQRGGRGELGRGAGDPRRGERGREGAPGTGTGTGTGAGGGDGGSGGGTGGGAGGAGGKGSGEGESPR